MGEYFRAEMAHMCDDGVFISCDTQKELNRCYYSDLSSAQKILLDMTSQKYTDPNNMALKFSDGLELRKKLGNREVFDE